MGKVDAYSRMYLNNRYIFADAINYAVFDGRQIIKPEMLTSADTRHTRALMNRLGTGRNAMVRESS